MTHNKKDKELVDKAMGKIMGGSSKKGYKKKPTGKKYGMMKSKSGRGY